MSPLLKATLAKASPQTQLVIQRYPLWLDFVVVAGFGLLMLLIAIWQFGRQE